jgi:putative ABC transport system permease protein
VSLPGRPSEPPRAASRLIRFFLRHEDSEGRGAEFDELFHWAAEERGLASARRAYWLHLGRSLPGLIMNFIYWECAMLKNYLTVAWRNIIRHKGISFINVVGLALGMACSLLIFLWVDKQVSYDRSQLNRDRIVRLEEGDWVDLPTSYRKVFDSVPEIEKYVQFDSWEKPTLRCGEKLFDAQNLVFADDAVFDVFNFSFLNGSPANAFKDPYSLVLSQSEARRLFGPDNPMGKTVIYENTFHFTVTGVVEDTDDFHIEWRALAPFKSLPVITGQDRFLDENNDNFPIYFLLRPNSDVPAFEKKISAALNALRSRPAIFHLRPFGEIYFSRDVLHEKGIKHGNLSLVIVFAAVAVLILLIACVNFINLVTARSSSRAKEISVRKAAGAVRKNLIFQFLGEASLTVFIALFLALVLVILLRPFFAGLVEESLTIDWTGGKWLAGLLVVFLFASLASGLFPAFYLSSLKPAALMREKGIKRGGRATFRIALIVFQFAVATFLIIGVLGVLRQMDYMKKKDLGFNQNQVLIVPLKGDLKEKTQVLRARLQEGKTIGEKKGVFKQRLLQSPDIRGVTFTSQVPGTLTTTNTWTVNGQPRPMIIMNTDPDFLDVMGLELVDGRNLSWDMSSDLGLSYVINEEAVPFLGLGSPLGKTVRANFGQSRIVGIVKNFHFRSLHRKIEPMGIVWFDGWADTAIIKVAGQNIGGAVAHIRDVWAEVCPEAPFSYSFMDETVGRLYTTEDRLSRILKSFVALAIFLSCLGLFGLSAYVAEQKTKEIGIRKVLGAKEAEIVILLSRDFSRWVLLANLFAWPVSYYALTKWLQSFAYRASLGFGTFLLASVLALMIAWMTVGWQSIKAARSNPADAIRHE